MSFSLKVTFTGIMSFAHHPEVEGAYRVLSPPSHFGELSGGLFKERPGDVRKALDDLEDLRRHFARVKVAGAKAPTELLLDEELIFGFEIAEPRGVTSADVDLEHVISLPTIGAAGLDDTAINDPAASARVGSHVDILQGSLSTDQHSFWRISSVLSGGGAEHEGCFAREVIWEVHDIDRLTIRTVPYGNGTPTERVFEGLDSRLDIRIANFDKAPWDTMGGFTGLRERDVDFKWHYESLSDEAIAEVKAKLAEAGPGTELPIPIPDDSMSCADPDNPTQSDEPTDPKGLPVDESGRVGSGGVQPAPPFGNCFMGKWF